VVVPYPVVVGGWGWGWNQPDQFYQPLTVIQQPAPPAVIVNQGYQRETVNPVVRDYSNADLPEPSFKVYHGGKGQGEAPSSPAEVKPANEPKAPASGQPTLFLIALQDGKVVFTYAYWFEKDTLYYVARDKSVNQVSLTLVDREVTQQLNRERGLEMRFPH
jgi:hypothetical protein